jgi:hypothetical protein
MLEQVRKIDEDRYLVREADGYVVEVWRMMFNWRLTVAPAGQEKILDRGFCYFGRSHEAFLRAVAAGLTWADPYGTEPDGFDKQAY